MSHREGALERSKLRLRDATETDAGAIAEIYNQSIAAGDATMDDVQESAADVRRRMANFNSRELILVLESPEETVGWGTIKRYSDRGGYRFAGETAVYLDRTKTGLGLGSMIKAALIERCRAFGYHHLVAKISAENTQSIEYNRKFGYELVGIQKEIGFRNGRWQDVAILQLVLPRPVPADPCNDKER